MNCVKSVSESLDLFSHGLYDMLYLELVPYSKGNRVSSEIGAVFLFLIRIIFHIYRVCNMAELTGSLANGVLGQFLHNKYTGAVGICIRRTLNVYIRLALGCLILLYVEIHPDVHQSSLKSTPPIITGSPMFFLRNFLKF